MLFRAIFTIGVVALMVPHEPNLGFGRPKSPLPVPSLSPSFDQAAKPGCSAPCGAAPGLLEAFRTAAFSRLDEVGREIEESRRARN
ncbi:MAG: hypothetical protein JOZ55_11785 [Alphaproteobacteria bacterium]|nr:hypothetical protein [Alphaproteobacteria bacterium]